MAIGNDNKTEKFRGKGAEAEINPCTRTAILEAAQRLFLHYGYKKTTIEDIAAEASIGKGTVYLYFGGKEEILLTIAGNVKRNVTDQMRAIAASLASPEEKLRRMIMASIFSVFDACRSTAHGIELVDEMLKPKIMACSKEHKEEQYKIIAQVIDEGVRRGEFSIGERDALTTAKLLTLTMVSFYPPYMDACHGQVSCKYALTERAEAMFDFVMRGMRSRG